MALTPLKITTKLHYSPKNPPKYPKFIRNSKGNEVVCADPNATRALVALMDLSAVNGGAASHWGGPAAIAEAMSSLHTIMFEKDNWFENYNFVNDIGHAENGIYALRANLGYGDLTIDDLKGFRSIESKLTGHGESHLYPEGVLLSNGPLSSALPQAQGLAMADKVIGNSRVTLCVMSDGASMEGEAKESFASIPGLAKKGKINPFVLIVSDNNTKLSGRISLDSYDMTPTFEAMHVLGWNTIKVENGNDLQSCYHAFEEAISKSKEGTPTFVWLKTVKGYGVKSTETASSGGHGFPLKPYSSEIFSFVEEIWGKDVPQEFLTWANELIVKPESNNSNDQITEKMQAGLARGAIKASKEGKPVFSISSDLQSSTGMSAFHKECPESSIDIGIAESNMVSIGAGMSKAGLIPIVDTFAAFGITKGNLPLIMSALSNCPQIAVFSHTGFQDAADGASHQSLTYLSAVSSIPYTNAIVIGSSKEGEELMYQAISKIEKDRLEGKDGESYIFFVGRENFPVEAAQNLNYELGKAQVIKKGRDGVIVSCGPLLYKAINAANILKEQGIEVTVINNSLINKPDLETIGTALKESKKLITIEDHQVVGGMGAQLVHALKQNGHEFKSYSLGVNGHFGQSAYEADQLYAKNNMDENSIVEAFKSL